MKIKYIIVTNKRFDGNSFNNCWKRTDLFFNFSLKTLPGIINELSDDPICDLTNFKIIPHVLAAICNLRSKGYKICIIFDQPAISKGLLTPNQVDVVNPYLMELLGQAGCSSIDGVYYCTSALPKIDIWAKPNTAMFKRAEIEQGLSFKTGGYYVGDSIEDLEAAVNAKAIPVLIKTGNFQSTLTRLNTFAKRKLKSKVKIYNSLLDFSQSLN
jgi:D-glycero-D-manno-heptose 1,7-bisphosphate phosphatase